MDWESYCQEFVTHKHDKDWLEFTGELAPKIRERYAQKSDHDLDWFEKALGSEEQKWFVAFVFKTVGSVPKNLFPVMIKTAVYEMDPNSSRSFIQPCIDTYGLRSVNEEILKLLENGSNVEKAAAATTLYWMSKTLSYPRNSSSFGTKQGTPESRTVFEDLHDISSRRRQLLLKEFVNNEDVQVRRSIIPTLKLDESVYPDELKPLVKKAIEIASSHPDEYIRQRLQIHLGNSNTYPALAPREKLKDD